MNILFTNTIQKQPNFHYQNTAGYSPKFCGKSAQKLIDRVISTRDDRKVQITFDEAVKIYNYLGYEVINKRGSHAIIPLENNRNLTLVIPHKDKNVALFDVKKIKYIIKGDIEKALSV